MLKYLIVIAVIIIGVGAFMWHNGSLSHMLESVVPPVQSTEVPQTHSTTTLPIVKVNVLPTDSSDTSDSALDADVKALDDQITGLKTDTSALDTNTASSSSTN